MCLRIQYSQVKIWYFVRLWLPLAYPLLCLVFMIVGLTGWNTVEGNLVLGSVLSVRLLSIHNLETFIQTIFIHTYIYTFIYIHTYMHIHTYQCIHIFKSWCGNHF